MASLDKTLLQDDQQQTPPANEETNDDLFYDFDQQHHQAPLANEESIDDDLFYDFDQAPSTSPTTPDILSDDINIGEESVSSSHGHDDITIDDEEELGSTFDSDRDHDDPDALECIDESTIVPALAACSSSTEPPPNRFDQLKARYKIARVGGKTVIVEANFRNAVTGHTYMRLHIISEFKKFYQPDFPDKKAMNHWLSTLDRCDQVGFYPGRSVPPHVFNTWRGFTYPIRDDLSADDCLAIITPFTNHICKAWCSNDKELEGYVMKWFAHTIQKPGQPVGVALILRGAEGSGKSIILTTLGSLHGRHFVHLTNQNELTADFNGWVEQAILAFADDGTWGSDRKAAGHLKTIITEPTLRSRRLFQEAESVPNHVHLVFGSNNIDVVPVGPTARRFAAIDVDPCFVGNAPYFAALAAVFKTEDFRIALITYLAKHVDISEFVPQHFPRACLGPLLEMKIESSPPILHWILDALESNGFPATSIKRDVYEDFLKHSRTHISVHVFFKSLKAIIPGITETRGPQDNTGKRIRFLQFPSLETCRTQFADYLQTPLDIVFK